jgi:hypothetical protein
VKKDIFNEQFNRIFPQQVSNSDSEASANKSKPKRTMADGSSFSVEVSAQAEIMGDKNSSQKRSGRRAVRKNSHWIERINTAPIRNSNCED